MKTFKEYITEEYKITGSSERNALGGVSEKMSIIDNGEEIAYIKTSVNYEKAVWILALYVAPEFRSRGLAKKLVNIVQQKYKEPIFLRVAAYKDEPLKDDQLIRFYTKLGFKQIPTMSKYYLKYENV